MTGVGLWTASIASVRIVSTQSSSMDSRTVLKNSSPIRSYYARDRPEDPAGNREHEE